LFETGELPTLGQDQGICASSYQPFSLSRGRPLVDMGGTGGGGGGSLGGGDSGGGQLGGANGSGGAGRGSGTKGILPTPRIANTGAGDSGSSEENKSGGAGGSSGGGTSNGGGRRFAPASASASNSSAKGTGGETISLSASETKEAQGRGDVRAFKRLSGSAQDEAVGRVRFVPSSNERKSQVDSGTIVATDADTKSKKGRRIANYDNSRTGNISDTDDAEGLTFPDFIRYLLIAAILGIIIVFFGGQFAAFRKGSEKS
jgi:hypothetical protein